MDTLMGWICFAAGLGFVYVIVAAVVNAVGRRGKEDLARQVHGLDRRVLEVENCLRAAGLMPSASPQLAAAAPAVAAPPYSEPAAPPAAAPPFDLSWSESAAPAAAEAVVLPSPPFLTPTTPPAAPAPPEPERLPETPATEPFTLPTQVSQPAAPAVSGPSWEERIGQWMGWLGAVTVAIAVGLFLKWAYDMGWITPLFHLHPMAYLSVGWLAGAAFLVGSERLRGGLPLYAQGLAGGGVAILYLTTYAGHALYEVLPASTATAGLALVGALAIAAALRHDSVVIGWIGVVLAYASPVVFGGGGSSPAPLFLYLTALNLVVLAISGLREWHAFRAAAFVATAVLYGLWHGARYSEVHLEAALTFVSANAAIFLGVLTLYPVLWRKATRDSDLTLAVLNPILAGGMIYSLLQPLHSGSLGLVALLFAGAHFAAARAIRLRRGEEDYLEQLFFGFAVAFTVLAAPLQFHGRAVTAAWALLGTVLSVVGYRSGARRTRGWGGLAVALSVGRLLVRDVWLAPSPGAAQFFNERGFSFALVIFALSVVAWLGLHQWRATERLDARLEGRFSVIALVICALMDLWVIMELPGLWPPVGWAGVAALALAFGWQVRSSGLRHVATLFVLLPVLAALSQAAHAPGGPYPVPPGWAAALALCLGAAVAYQRTSDLTGRWRSPVYAAVAALLLLVEAAAALAPMWQTAAWAGVALAALGAGFAVRSAGHRAVGVAVAGLTLIRLSTQYVDHAPGLGWGAGALLLVCVAAAWTYARRDWAPEGERNGLLPTMAGTAAASAMLWALADLGPGWVSVAWLGVCALLLWSGVSLNRASLRMLGLIVAASLTGELLIHSLHLQPSATAFFHSRTVAALAALAAWIASTWVVFRHGSDGERSAVPVLIGLVNLHALGWLSLEAMDVAGRVGPAAWAREASQFGLSAVWVLYAAGAIAVGFRRSLAPVRWGGMGLLLLAVAKVYLFDLGFLALGYRVLSFLVLAMVLLGVSYVYQKQAAADGKAARTP